MAVARGRDGARLATAGASFGDLLKAFRKAAGLTQEQLAERAGYSTVYVSMLERGQRLPLQATAGSFADALELGQRDRLALERVSGPIPHTDTDRAGMALVGRTRELALIERFLHGQGPSVLLLGGEPGIGKTRLLREAGSLAGMYGLRVLEGGCLRRGGEEPFAPMLQALQSYMHSQDESRLRKDLAGCAWLVRLLPELRDGPIEKLPPWTIPAEQERRLMDDAVIRFLGNVAGPGGTLLILDDLQWAATDGLDLLRLLANSAGPVRILGAYRESEIGSHHPLAILLADLAQRGLVSHVTLGAISNEEASDLLDQLLEGASEVGNDVREQVLTRADGVPFFLVSCAYAMKMRGMANERGDGTPWDLTQSIRQRVAALPETASELLGRAAVVGRRIPHSILVAVGGEQEDELLEGLDAAIQARLLEESEGHTYQFTHDVIREVIESDLGAARRTVLHRQIGAALERRGGTVEVLAYHYARSTDDDKAVWYLERAGSAAEAKHAIATAEGYYRELVDRLDGLGRLEAAASAGEKLGRVLTTMAGYEDALAILEQAAGEYRRAGDVEGEARAAAQIGRVHYLKGTPEEGVERLSALRDRLIDGPATHGLAALNTALAPLLLAQGRYREQREAAEAAARIARTLSDDRILAEAEVWRGCALNQLGDLDEGRRVLKAAIPAAERAADLTSLVHALNDMGFLYEIGGEFAQSRIYKRRALDVAERVGDPAAMANMTFRCGQTAFLSGDWTAARELFERSLATARKVEASSILAYPLFGLGLLALAKGDRDVVTHLAEECLTIAAYTADKKVRRAGMSLLAERDLQAERPQDARARLLALETDTEGLDLQSTLPTLAEACLRDGDLDAAHAWIEDGVRRAMASHSRVGLVDVLRVKVLALTETGRSENAAAVLDEALQLARAMPYPFAVARLLYIGGILHKQTGEQKQALLSLNEALGIFKGLDATWHARLAEKYVTTR